MNGLLSAHASEQAAWGCLGQRPSCLLMASSGSCGSGATWRDLPEMFGPYTTCYNRFVRSRRAGVWGRNIDALAAAHGAAVQMIDTSIVRAHQHGVCITRNRRQSMGRSRGGLTNKMHAVVDSNGLPVRLALSPGETHEAALRCRFGSASVRVLRRALRQRIPIVGSLTGSRVKVGDGPQPAIR